MKKFLFLSIVFAFAFTSTDWTDFTSPDDFYTCKYPSNWQLTKNGTNEFIFRDQAVDQGTLVMKQERTDNLAGSFEEHKANVLKNYIGSHEKDLGYEDYVAYEKRETLNGSSAIRYYWITGNDKYTVTIYYQIPFDLRTKKEVLEEQKQVFRILEGLKIQE